MAKPRSNGLFRDNGLSLVFFGLFTACLIGQSLAGWLTYNNQRQEHGDTGVSYSSYLGNPHFWQAMGENRESEFLAVFSMVVLSIFLRQKGSPESKPLAAAHSDTEGDPPRPSWTEHPGRRPDPTPNPRRPNRRRCASAHLRLLLSAPFLVLRYANCETLSPGLGAQGCVAPPWNSPTIPASGRLALNPNPSPPSSHNWHN